jgi:hypothetical protein
MSRNALNLLRSATSSLSPLAISRPSYPAHRRALIVSRNFSGTTSEKARETPEESGSAEKAEVKQDSVSPSSELEAKLKAKEGEVLDVTVRLSCCPSNMAALSDPPSIFRVACDISKPTF